MSSEELYKAVSNKDLQKVKRIVNGLSETIDSYSYEPEFTALMFACEHATAEIVSYLVQEGAEPGYEVSSDNTCIKAACKNKEHWKTILGILFEKIGDSKKHVINWNGDEYKEKFVEGKTPLLIAVADSNYELINYLIKNGAEISIDNYMTGETPLSVALGKNDRVVIDILVKAGAQLDRNAFSRSISGLDDSKNMLELFKNNSVTYKFGNNISGINLDTRVVVTQNYSYDYKNLYGLGIYQGDNFDFGWAYNEDDYSYPCIDIWVYSEREAKSCTHILVKDIDVSSDSPRPLLSSPTKGILKIKIWWNDSSGTEFLFCHKTKKVVNSINFAVE